MTIQQLEYLVALGRERHFVRAAEACGVTQPTLSAMIQKLEDELGAELFDRSAHPIEPTAAGRAIIAQAQTALSQIARIRLVLAEERETLAGQLRIGVIPTVAPYLLPDFLHVFREKYPDVQLQVNEMHTSEILTDLPAGGLDLAILATPLPEQGRFLAVPLYYERFWAYVSPGEPVYKKKVLSAADMPLEHLWVLQEGHCMRNQVFNFCEEHHPHNRVFEAGSIDTLVRIVDHNGGYTVIPELHVPLLTGQQRQHIRPIDDPPAVREISLIIRPDFLRERMLNAVADTVKAVIPTDMIDTRLRRFAIRI